MALSKLVFKPGINKDQTNYASEGGWFDMDKVRFRSGFPEKIGGWLKATSTTVIGVCRSMFNWVTSDGNNLLGLGTNKKIYVEVGGNYYDITPIRATFATAVTDNCFATTNLSNTVTVTIANHSALTGDYVLFSGSVAVGGISAANLNTNFEVSVINTNSFTITTATSATSTVAAGGGASIVAKFDIHAGNINAVYGYGWGVSTWGRGTWGSGTSLPIEIPPRLYSQDRFNDDLIINIRGGDIYYWVYDNTFATRAVLLSSLAGASSVPQIVSSILFSQVDRHLLAFGGTNYITNTYDPLLIRWADQDRPWYWAPMTTNSSGFLRVSNGSEIIKAIRTRQEIVVLTDSTAYSLQFLATQDVFGLQQLAENISIASPGAVAIANNVLYWMGNDKFYTYGGRVETLPCTLRQYIFDDSNHQQHALVVSGTNEEYSEIIWFYPSLNANEIDRYVIYNYLEGIWYYGNLVRTAWLDSQLRNYPQAMDVGGNLYNHELGPNDDVLPMTAYISSGDIDIEDGNQFMLINRLIPDINFTESTSATPTVTVTIKPRNFPGAAYQTDNAENTGISEDVIRTATVPVDQYTNQVFIRVRGRQISFKISSDALGVAWQLGMPRIDARPDGKRG